MAYEYKAWLQNIHSPINLNKDISTRQRLRNKLNQTGTIEKNKVHIS